VPLWSNDMKRPLILALAAGAMLLASGAARASDVHWSIGINLPPVATVISGGPVYGPPVAVYEPPPVIYPAPVYREPPVVYGPPVVYAPPVVYRGPRFDPRPQGPWFHRDHDRRPGVVYRDRDHDGRWDGRGDRDGRRYPH
jgi:hypothetical protein